jgi:hypothetical protein
MKSVIIYTYYNSGSSNYNLAFFVKRELSYKENIDYIIVINGFEYDTNIVFPEIENLTIIKRENIGFDFGGHNAALNHISEKGKIYDYYFFMNSGVIGPILPHYLIDIPNFHWSGVFINKINDLVKLVGTTIVCLLHDDPGGFGPKVEGFFFMVDQIGLDIIKEEKTIFYDHPSKYSAIVRGEYAVSKCILKKDYSIDCMLHKYQNIDWQNPENYHINNNCHPSRKNSYFGHSINPFEVIFHKWHWHNQESVNFEMVEEYLENFMDK